MRMIIQIVYYALLRIRNILRLLIWNIPVFIWKNVTTDSVRLLGMEVGREIGSKSGWSCGGGQRSDVTRLRIETRIFNIWNPQ